MVVQKTTPHCKTKAEFRLISSTLFEIYWLCSLLFELGVQIPKLVLYCANFGATFACTSPVYHSKTKHIGIDFCFIRDKIA